MVLALNMMEEVRANSGSVRGNELEEKVPVRLIFVRQAVMNMIP